MLAGSYFSIRCFATAICRLLSPEYKTPSAPPARAGLGDGRRLPRYHPSLRTTGGAGGIRTRDPHPASVMRSHCATAPLDLRSSTLITDVTPASARSRDSRSRLPGEFGVPGHRLAPTAGSLRQGFRVLLPIVAFRSIVDADVAADPRRPAHPRC